MSTSDDKPYPLRARDYRLPKPYQRKRFVDDEPDMSRTRVTMLMLSGLTIAMLIAALAVLAADSLDTGPILIVAAPAGAMTVAPAPITAMLPAPPSVAEPAVAAALPALSVPPVARTAPLLRAKITHQPLLPIPAEPAPQDADVVLISAILRLTPHPESDAAQCDAGLPGENGCAALEGMKP